MICRIRDVRCETGQLQGTSYGCAAKARDGVRFAEPEGYRDF
jgi:hypothetical protein